MTPHKHHHTPMIVPVLRFGVMLYRAQCQHCDERGKLRWRLSKAWQDCDAMDGEEP